MKHIKKAAIILVIIMIINLFPVSAVYADDAIDGNTYYIVNNYSYYELQGANTTATIKYFLAEIRDTKCVWKLEADGDYFRIRNESTGKYLHVNYDSCSSYYTCSLRNSSTSAYQRWKITRNSSDGSFYITMKNSPGKYLTYIVNRGGTPNLAVSSSSGNNSKWRLCVRNVKESVGIISGKNDGQRSLINSYYENSEKDHYLNAFSEIVKKDSLRTRAAVFNEMAKHRMVVFDGHGSYNPISGGRQVYGDAYVGYEPITGWTISEITNSNKFKDVRLVFYRGCGAAGVGEVNNQYSLPEETVKKGANCAIGYLDNVYIPQEADWYSVFIYYISYYSTVLYSIDKADKAFFEEYGTDVEGPANVVDLRSVYGDIYQSIK